MLIENLKELGLSENEAKIYIALLELGSCTTGPIIKKSGLYRVIVYDTLEKLLEKGLVHYSVRKNRKEFSAENPKRIVEIIKDKENLANETAKALSQLQISHKPEQGAFVYEGWKGIKAAQENYLKEMKPKKGEYLMVGASRVLHKKLDAFFNHFHEQRSKKAVPARLLFNENNRQFGKTKAKFKPVQVRFMPPNVVTPSWISLYEDMVLIGVAEDTPMAFFIRNKTVAESYRHYFSFMWQQGLTKPTNKRTAD